MLLTEKYQNKIKGVLSCYDRIIIQGTLPGLCYADGMASFLNFKKIPLINYPKFAEPYRDILHKNAERIAKDNGLEIEFIRKRDFRKETRIKEILEKRGSHPGLVWIFSAMEPCASYRYYRDKNTGFSYLRGADGKCLHFYFYFIDEDLGLCYIRVPSWCPFRLQVYCNGHQRLANQLKKHGINYKMLDNAFVEIDDFDKAQELSDCWEEKFLHSKLDEFADIYCPILKYFNLKYHWSLDQCEYSTDIVFHKQKDLQAIYENLTFTAIHTIKPENIATFLGRKLDGKYQDEMGNRFDIRIEGTRIKHSMGKVSIKMYDKFAMILRIETTTNDVGFFKHYREVEQRNGIKVKKYAEMKKSIYSLGPLREASQSANRRYLEFISAIDEPGKGIAKLDKITKTVQAKNRAYKGFNVFDDEDEKALLSISKGEYNISGFQNKTIRKILSDKSSGQISRLLKRLHLHNIIKKAGKTYKYYVTRLGRQVISAMMKIKQLFLIPELSKNNI